jgi:hypothetical protein
VLALWCWAAAVPTRAGTFNKLHHLQFARTVGGLFRHLASIDTELGEISNEFPSWVEEKAQELFAKKSSQDPKTH